jgi:hypothetical protein
MPLVCDGNQHGLESDQVTTTGVSKTAQFEEAAG